MDKEKLTELLEHLDNAEENLKETEEKFKGNKDMMHFFRPSAKKLVDGWKDKIIEEIKEWLDA